MREADLEISAKEMFNLELQKQGTFRGVWPVPPPPCRTSHSLYFLQQTGSSCLVCFKCSNLILGMFRGGEECWKAVDEHVSWNTCECEAPIIFILTLQPSHPGFGTLLLPHDYSVHRLLSPQEGCRRLSNLHLLCKPVVLLLSVREALPQPGNHKANLNLPECCRAAFTLSVDGRADVGVYGQADTSCWSRWRLWCGRGGGYVSIWEPATLLVHECCTCFAFDSLGPPWPRQSLLPQFRKDALCASSVTSLPMPLYHRIFPLGRLLGYIFYILSVFA